MRIRHLVNQNIFWLDSNQRTHKIQSWLSELLDKQLSIAHQEKNRELSQTVSGGELSRIKHHDRRRITTEDTEAELKVWDRKNPGGFYLETDEWRYSEAGSIGKGEKHAGGKRWRILHASKEHCGNCVSVKQDSR